MQLPIIRNANLIKRLGGMTAIALFLSIFSSDAHSATGCTAELVSYNHSIENCSDGETLKFGNTTFDTCMDCETYAYSETITDSQCSNTATRTLCAKTCTKKTVESWIDNKQIEGCTNEDIIQVGTSTYHVCEDCDWGYKMKQISISDKACSNTITDWSCEYVPPEDRACEDDSDCWEITGNDPSKVGVDTNAWCYNGVSCSEGDGYYWYCADGYYGEGYGSSESDISCTQCPSLNGVKGHSPSPYSNTYVTSCYIPKNTQISNTKGTYEFISNCNASN